MTSSPILTLYLILFALKYSWETFLTWLNIRHVRRHAPALPLALAGTVDQPTLEKATAYTLSRSTFGLSRATFSSLLLLAIILSGALGMLDTAIGGLGLGTYIHGVVYIYAISLVFTLAELPFSIYGTFVIEEKFGFNKTTPALFAVDLLKELAVAALLMAPLLLALFWFMDTAGVFWWAYAFFLFAGFRLLMIFIYPTVIAPLFNKFTPLESGSLRDKITALTARCGFRTRGVFKMDSSKRSRHSNAYFTGLGRVKRIVLFDTLLATLEEDQVVSVLAHEIGHEKKHHIRKGFILSLLATLAGLYVLGLLLNYPPFYRAFGFAGPSYHAAVILFGFCAGPFTFFLAPLGAMLSRKYEYEADRFAVDVSGTAEHLKAALLKLSRDNLTNYWPHPWYSFYHYSHPTLTERLAALENNAPAAASEPARDPA